MKTKRRFLSILLSLALVLGLMPGMSLTAYAANNYTNGQSVTFRNVAVGDTYEAGAVISQDDDQVWSFTVYIDDCAAGTGRSYTVPDKLTVTAKSDGNIYCDSERTYNLDNATVAVDIANGSTSVKVGDWNVASSKYDVKYGAIAENATETFPTAAGSYYAFVTAKDTDARFTGGTKSAVFTVAATSTDTETSFDSTEDITIALSGVTVSGGRIKGDNGSITFTSTAGKIKKIEISSGGKMTVRSPSSGWNECRGSGPLVWKGTAADSVTLSAQRIDIRDFSQIVYTLESISDISDVTVNVDTENQTVSVTRGNAFITEDEYTVKYGADAEHATLTAFPTEPGTYVAVVTAKTGSTYYTGSVTSAEFTIASAHTHAFTYSASGATITASCGADGCDLTSAPTLTIVKPTLTTYGQTGDGISASATLTGLEDFNTATGKTVAATDIKYYKATKGEGGVYTKGDEITTGAPTGAGDYLAEITVSGVKTSEGEDKSVTASVGYTIARADSTAATVTANNRTYDATEKPLVTVTGEPTGGEMQYALGTETEATEQYTTSIPTAINAGTYYVWYKVVGDDNHNSSTPASVSVTISKAEVTAPTIASKTYNTEKQTATVAASDLYTVTTNEGGTNVGSYDVVLTLNDSDNYKWTDSTEAAKTLTFRITQATAPTVDTPTPDAVTYDPAKTLEDVTLADGWAWVDSTIVPTVNNEGYSAAYTVTDDTNYDYTGIDGYSAENHKVTRTVVLTVNKADPTADAPTGLTATYGQTLADVTLTNPDGNTAGTWAWADADTTSVGNAGSITFKANFTPTDTTNYNSKENVDVTVTVDKADPTATAPTASATYGQTLADVTLTNPSGNTAGTWSWVDAGTTSVGNAGSNTFKANFTPADTTNYNSKTNVNVTVTVGKADPSAEVTPVIGLVYDGTTKKLVTAEVEGGTLQYRIGEDGEWTESIPEAVDFDTYTIYYYIKGDANHKDAGSELEPLGSVEVTIKCPYSNEWVKGKWYNKDGSQTYKSLGSWQKDGTDWMYVDESGWTAKNRWQKIDFKWYFFDQKGHMLKDAYQKDASGKIWYLGKNGAWDEKAAVIGWKQDAKGWWFGLYGNDYLKDGWKMINGNWYYFKSTGYIAVNEFVQGWWLNQNGAQKDPVKYSWHKTSKGWWYGVSGGWYAKNATYTIDGKSYTFDKMGYQK